MDALKTCSACRCTVTLDHFSINRKGVQYKCCNNCRKGGKNYESRKENFKTYYQKNREDKLEYGNNRYANKKDEAKAYFQANKQAICEREKKYRETERETNIDFNIKYKLYSHISNDRKKIADFALTDDYIDLEWVKKELESCRYCCHYCQQKLKTTGYEPYDDQQFSIDRIENSWGHVKDNCIISCLKCNLDRNDMIYEDFKAKFN